MEYYKIPKHFLLATLSIFVLVALILYQRKFYKPTENIRRDSIYENIKSSAYEDPNVDFTMYVDKFYRDLEIYCHYPTRPQKMIIKFADIDKIKGASHINAISYGLRNDELIEIYVNPSFWKKAKRSQKYWLMYHELSHDVLNLDDLEAVPENVGKLMYPQMGVMDITDMDEFIEAFHNLFDSM